MTRAWRLIAVLVLNLVLVAALVVVGVAAHSLAVLAEGGDYVLDAAGVGVALVAMWLSARAKRHPGARQYPNAGAWAALVNAGWLCLLELLVAAGAIDRLVSGVPVVHGLPVLIVSAVAAIVMTGGALILGGDLDDDPEDADGHRLSVRAVLLDTVADAAAAAGVALTGGIIWALHGAYWLDPVVALIIANAIGWHAIRLLMKIRQRLAGRVRTTRPSPFL